MTLSTDLNKMMEQYPQNIVVGRHESFGVVSLRRPSFDFDWYWGFGYLGNRNCHLHLSGLTEGENINLRDAILKRFGDTFFIKDSKRLWQFVEVVQTVYTLNKTAEIFYSGGSHYTTNPDAETLKNREMYEHFVRVLIPRQIAAMYAIIAEEQESRSRVI